VDRAHGGGLDTHFSVNETASRPAPPSQLLLFFFNQFFELFTEHRLPVLLLGATFSLRSDGERLWTERSPDSLPPRVRF
jgi:hypothetical protein